MRNGAFDPNIFNFIDIMKLLDLIVDYLFAECDHSVVLGYIVRLFLHTD